ncbi:hypothetical protein V6N13_110960 [Hibiscus sabdariffa]
MSQANLATATTGHWFVDSGATHHVSPDSSKIADNSGYSGPGAECATNPSGGVNTGIRESVSLRLVPGAERLWQNSEPVITVGGDRPTDPVVVRDWVESVIEPIPVESATANGDPLFATGSSSLGRHDEGEHSLVGDPGVTSSVGMAGNVVESNLGDVGCESGNNVHGVVIGSCDEVGMAAECDNSLHEEVPSSRGEPDMAVSSDPEEVVTPGCYDAVVVGYTTHRFMGTFLAIST